MILFSHEDYNKFSRFGVTKVRHVFLPSAQKDNVGDNNSKGVVWIGFPIVALLRASAGAAVEDRFREYKWHARSSSRTQLTPLLLAHKNGLTGKLSHLTNSETPSPTTFYPIAPTKTPSFSPTGFPTHSPTANRLNMTIDRLTSVSGAEGFRNLTSPQYRAALHVANQDELIVSRGPPQTVAALFVDRVLFRHERRQLIVQQKQYT